MNEGARGANEQKWNTRQDGPAQFAGVWAPEREPALKAPVRSSRLQRRIGAPRGASHRILPIRVKINVKQTAPHTVGCRLGRPIFPCGNRKNSPEKKWQRDGSNHVTPTVDCSSLAARAYKLQSLIRKRRQKNYLSATYLIQ